MKIFLELLLIAFLALTLFCRRPITEDQAKKIFSKVTGIQWDANFTIIALSDDHGGFQGEGEFAVIVQAPEAQISKILSDEPPWGASWLAGPVDGEIGYHCSFTYPEAPGALGAGTDHVEYVGGSDEVRTILSSTNVKWCAKQRGTDHIPWHNGNLLIVEPTSRELWLCVWDM